MTLKYDSRTPLHIAASEGHALVVEAMLTERAPVYVRDRSGNTPLSDAVRNKNFQCIELLRNAGAQLKVRKLGFSEKSFRETFSLKVYH